MMSNSVSKLGPIACLCCGFVTLIAMAAVYMAEASETSHAGCTAKWPKTTGTVISTYQEKERAGFGTNETTYICYNYAVADKKYISNKIYYDQFGSGTYLAPADRYHVDQTVPVFYNPAEPQHAVLRAGPEPKKSSTGKYLVGALFGLSLCFAGVMRLSRRPML